MTIRLSICGLALVVLTSLSGVALGGDVKVQSHWNDQAIAVDGVEDDWVGRQVYVEDLKGVIGVVNDSEYIYVSISTQREDLLRQMMMSGLTVWLDGDGKKKREFGVRFGRSRPPMTPGQSRPDAPPNFDSLMSSLDTSSLEAQLIGVDGMVLEQLGTAVARPSIASMAFRDNRLVFEFRLPIVRNAEHPQAVGGQLGKKITLGLETAKRQDGPEGRPRPGGMGGPPPGVSPPSGGGPPSGGFGGGMGRGGHPPGGGFGERPKSFEMWAKVTLASGPLANVANENE